MIEEIRRLRSELAAICLRHNLRRLDLFGSAIGNDFDAAASELDFWLSSARFRRGDTRNTISGSSKT
jgi:hypothetical protein